MTNGLGAFGAGGGGSMYSINPSASSFHPQSGMFGGSMFGGINTGTQGIDVTTLAIIGGVVLVALWMLKR